MKQDASSSFKETLKAIAQGRERTNLLRRQEQRTIAYIVQRIPGWVSSDMLTAIGFLGNVIVALSFVLGTQVNRYCLLIGLIGFFVSWFGDSLDGRLAYYRNSPRKWYGFCLDLVVDWLGIILMGLGATLYLDVSARLLGYTVVVLYGLEMILALLRYKVSGQYSIDAGVLGPTEARIIISIILVLEVLFPGVIVYMLWAATVVLLLSNLLEFRKVLRMADVCDAKERAHSEKR